MAACRSHRKIQLIALSVVVLVVFWNTLNRGQTLLPYLSFVHSIIELQTTNVTNITNVTNESSSASLSLILSKRSTKVNQSSNQQNISLVTLPSSSSSPFPTSTKSFSSTDEHVDDEHLPSCYSSLGSRFLPLDGDWVENYNNLHQTTPDTTTFDTTHQLAYWNLSCPLEFSKYSCVGQGKYDQAFQAATTRFIPRYCRFATTKNEATAITTLARVLKDRRVVLHGDSLLRQIYISLGCLLYARGEVTKMDVPWPDCDAASTPKLTKAQKVERLNSCPEGLANCRLCGPHSFVHNAPIVIHLAHNASLSVQNFKDADFESLTPRDVLITEAGAHGGDKVVTKLLRRRIGNYIQMKQEDRPILLHIITWSSHFATDMGRYQPTLLEEKKVAGESLQCRSSVPTDRMDLELSVLGEPKWVVNNVTLSLLQLFAGVIWINGTNNQGRSKVGQGGGPYQDCQHFCQPGPPDEFARALETMLLQVLVSDSTTSANVATYGDLIKFNETLV